MPLRTLRLATSLLGLPILIGAACERNEEPQAREAGPASDDATAKAKKVGYDIRRLRPRNEEPLSDMFARMERQARADDKRVAVLFSADWCEPCQRLDLELGNMHAPEEIGHIRILELKEEDWEGVTRMDEFNELRARWSGGTNTYPLFIVLDEEGKRVEEMHDAIVRLEQEGVEPTVAHWFAGLKS